MPQTLLERTTLRPARTQGSYVVPASLADGTTTVTAQIQSYLDAARDAGGGRVRLPPGVGGKAYRANGLVIYPNTELDATGATIRHAGFEGPMISNGAYRTTGKRATDGVTTVGSATLTSDRIGFAQSDVGRSIVLQHGATGMLPLATTIASVESATSCTLATTVQNSVAPSTSNTAPPENPNNPNYTGPLGDYVFIGTRDANIRVVGGVWDRGAVQGSDDWRRHTFLFFSVDNLVIDEVTIKSTMGKYSIHMGDVTRVRVRKYHVEVISDGCHVSGPASGVRIEQVSGYSGDDSVVFTAVDGYQTYQDSFGAWTDCHVEDVTAKSTTTSVKFRSDGRTLPCSGSLSRNHYGMTIEGGINAGGIIDRLVITDCQSYIRVNAIYLEGTIRQLVIRGHRFDAPANNRRMLDIRNTTTIEHLVMQGITGRSPLGTTGNHMLAFDATVATIGHVDIADVDWRMTGSSNIVSLINANAVIGHINIARALLRSDTAGSGTMVSAPSGAAGALLTSLHLQDCECEQTSAMVSIQVATAVHFDGCRSAGPALATGANAVVVHGAGNDFADNTGIASGGTTRCRDANMRIDATRLGQVKGDRCWNLSSTVGGGTGPVISDGTRWLPIGRAMAQGTATLVNGTVTVAHTAMTGVALIRLTVLSPGAGSPGHVYVSARTSGTGFTITSTSNTDTSVVFWEIVQYS